MLQVGLGLAATILSHETTTLPCSVLCIRFAQRLRTLVQQITRKPAQITEDESFKITSLSVAYSVFITHVLMTKYTLTLSETSRIFVMRKKTTIFISVNNVNNVT